MGAASCSSSNICRCKPGGEIHAPVLLGANVHPLLGTKRSDYQHGVPSREEDEASFLTPPPRPSVVSTTSSQTNTSQSSRLSAASTTASSVSPFCKYRRIYPGPLEISESEYNRRSQEDLFDSARSGDFKKMVASISAGADIHKPTCRGQTALMLASAAPATNIDCVRFLMEAYAELEQKDDNGWTAVLHACRSSRAEVLEYLLEVQASLRVRSKDGKTAAILATLDGAENHFILSLLQKGVAIEKKDNQGWPILFYACQAGRIGLVKSLLDRKASVKDTDADGKTALMIAAENGNTKMADTLLKRGCDLNGQNAAGNTAFMLALIANELEFAEHLMEKYAGLDLLRQNCEHQDAMDMCSTPHLHRIKMKIYGKTKGKEEVSIQDLYELRQKKAAQK